MAALGSHAAKAEIFDFNEFIHTVLGALAAQAGFLYSAERRDLRGNNSGVDADDAIFERFRHTPHTGDIAPVKVSGQAKFRVVSEGHGVRLRFETKEGRNGTKCFFARDRHLRRDIGENGRLEKAAAESVALSAYKNFCTFGLRVADVAFHLFDGGIVNQRT